MSSGFKVTAVNIQNLGTQFEEEITQAVGSLTTADGVRTIQAKIDEANANLAKSQKAIGKEVLKNPDYTKAKVFNKSTGALLGTIGSILSDTEERIKTATARAMSAIQSFEVAKKAEAEAQDLAQLVPPAVEVESSAPAPMPQPETSSATVSTLSPSSDVEPPSVSSVVAPSPVQAPRVLSLTQRAVAFRPTRQEVAGAAFAVAMSVGTGSPVPALFGVAAVTANRTAQLVTGSEAAPSPAPVQPIRSGASLTTSVSPKPPGPSITGPAHAPGPALTNTRPPVGKIDLGAFAKERMARQTSAATVPSATSSAPVMGSGPSVSSLRKSVEASLGGRAPIGAKRAAAATVVAVQPEPEAEKPLAHATLERPSPAGKKRNKPTTLKFKAGPEDPATAPSVTVVKPGAATVPSFSGLKVKFPAGPATPPPKQSGPGPAVLPPKPPAADPTIFSKHRLQIVNPDRPKSFLAQPNDVAGPALPPKPDAPVIIQGTKNQLSFGLGKVACTFISTYMLEAMYAKKGAITPDDIDTAIDKGVASYTKAWEGALDEMGMIADERFQLKQNPKTFPVYDLDGCFAKDEMIRKHFDRIDFDAVSVKSPEVTYDGTARTIEDRDFDAMFNGIRELADQTPGNFVGAVLVMGTERGISEAFPVGIKKLGDKKYEFYFGNSHGTDGLQAPGQLAVFVNKMAFQRYVSQRLSVVSKGSLRIQVNVSALLPN